MSNQDWRDASAEEIAPLYAAERARWLSELSWDPTEGFGVVEHGRKAGHVAGWLSRAEDGRVDGWTFYVLHDQVLQIGGLVGDRPAVVRRLLDEVLASPEAAVAKGLSCFVFPKTQGTSSALERQRFVLRDSIYLSRTIEPAGEQNGTTGLVRPWTTGDFAGTVRVLAAAYAGVPGAACFAQDGTREQWAHYTWQVLKTPGCGRFDPSLSRVLCAPGSTTPAAVALATWIGPAAVHVAQVAVAPDLRGRGVAGELMAGVFDAADRAGARRVTLMVDADNEAARRLYGRLGFTERSRMLYGRRAARNRVAA